MTRRETRAPEASGLPARRAALQILTQVRKGAPLDAALQAAVPSLGEADRRLAHEIAAGVFRRQADLDARLIPLVRHGWGNVPPALRDVLRIGAYQLTALDRVPAHAAVSVTVDLARTTGGAKAAGFVNAILRNLGGRAAAPPLVLDPAAHYAAVHSHPAWLVERWLARYGVEHTVALLEWNNTQPTLVLQPARDSAAALEVRWREAGIEPEAWPRPVSAGHPHLGFRSPARHPRNVPGFAEGAFYVQDPAHALVAAFAAPVPGLSVYDVCAAPGGKSIALGRSAALVVAGDLRRDRVRRLAENLARAGSGRELAVVADGAAPPVESMDLVVLDAPCLGTGTFARHPDARWRASADALGSLVERQRRLLEGAATAVRPGGWLVYATCSLEPEENEVQVDAFLARHPEFTRDPGEHIAQDYLSPAGDLEVLPFRHGMDGAWAARLRRA